jgi:hypothetical protein
MISSGSLTNRRRATGTRPMIVRYTIRRTCRVLHMPMRTHRQTNRTLTRRERNSAGMEVTYGK